MKDIEVIVPYSKENPFVLINKPAHLPSAPIKQDDDCALNRAISLFPEIKNVSGRKAIEYGLLHRLDTETSGLLLIACTNQCYQNLSEQQENNQFIKWYKAQIQKLPENIKREGFPDKNFQISSNFEVISKFRKFGLKGREVRPVIQSSGAAALKKAGETEYSTLISLNENEALCRIYRGFRHQVRCHLSWAGIPVKGDQIYNPLYQNETEMDFKAVKIEFIHPVSGQKVQYSLN